MIPVETLGAMLELIAALQDRIDELALKGRGEGGGLSCTRQNRDNPPRFPASALAKPSHSASLPGGFSVRRVHLGLNPLPGPRLTRWIACGR